MSNLDLLVDVAMRAPYIARSEEKRVPIPNNTTEVKFLSSFDNHDPEKYPLIAESELLEKYAGQVNPNRFHCAHPDCRVQALGTPRPVYSEHEIRLHINYIHNKLFSHPFTSDLYLFYPLVEPCVDPSVESERLVSPEMNDCHMESKQPAHPNNFLLNLAMSASIIDSQCCSSSPRPGYVDSDNEIRRHTEPDPQPTSSWIHFDHDYSELHGSIPDRNEENVVSDHELDDNQMVIDAPVNMILPQFVIKTPQYPYIHDPVGFEVSEIEELDANGNAVDRKHPQKQLANACLIHSVCDGDKKPKKPALRSRKSNRTSTGSVLGCVENQEKFRSDTRRVPRSSRNVEANENSSASDEANENSNLENFEHSQMQELAMKYAKQLKAKKKGRRNEPYVCKMCSTSFTAKTTLLQHYYSKAGYKSYECDICNKKFTRHSSLTYHQQVHANFNRFTCTDCSRGFRHPYHYKNHMADHKGPHTCPLCASPSFKTISTYKRHLKMQHDKVLTSKGLEDVPKTN